MEVHTHGAKTILTDPSWVRRGVLAAIGLGLIGAPWLEGSPFISRQLWALALFGGLGLLLVLAALLGGRTSVTIDSASRTMTIVHTGWDGGRLRVDLDDIVDVRAELEETTDGSSWNVVVELRDGRTVPLTGGLILEAKAREIADVLRDLL